MSANLEVVIGGAMKLRTSSLHKPPSIVLDRLLQGFIKSLCRNVISCYTSYDKLWMKEMVVKIEIVIEMDLGMLLPLILE